MGTFWIGDGYGITFQMRTVAQLKGKRDALSELSELNREINHDIYETFEKEGAIEGFKRWEALSPAYRERKEREGFGNKILTRKWKLGDAAVNGRLVFLNQQRVVIGYRFGGDKSKIEPYAYAIYFGRKSAGQNYTGNSKSKRRLHKKVLGKGYQMPGRPYVRIKAKTERLLNEKVGNIWAKQNIDTYFVRMAHD